MLDRTTSYQWITLLRLYCTNICIEFASQPGIASLGGPPLIQDWGDPPVEVADPTNGYGPYKHQRINQFHVQPGQRMAEIIPTLTTTRKTIYGWRWRSISSRSVQSMLLPSMIRFRIQCLEPQSQLASHKEAWVAKLEHSIEQ